MRYMIRNHLIVRGQEQLIYKYYPQAEISSNNRNLYQICQNSPRIIIQLYPEEEEDEITTTRKVEVIEETSEITSRPRRVKSSKYLKENINIWRVTFYIAATANKLENMYQQLCE